MCFAYTRHHFTAGHVSDQRGEGVNSTVKTGGMKAILVKSTFAEAFDRIAAVSRKVNLDARQELESLRQEGKRVGRKHSIALTMCKAAAIKLSSVEKHSELQNSWVVKHKSSSVKSSSVDLKTAIK